MKYWKMFKILFSTAVFAFSTSQAGVLYEWDFSSQTDGTALSDIASGGTEASVNFSASAVATGLTVSNGSLVVNWAGSPITSAAQNSYADISDLSSGTYWLVYKVDAVSTPVTGGIMDVYFNSGDTVSDAIAALRFNRQATGQNAVLLTGDGNQFVVGVPTSTATPITFAVELNRDTSKTRLLYKIGDNDWVTGTEYNAKSSLDVTHICFAASGYPAGNEIDLGTLYLTDVNPSTVPEPAGLSLMVLAGSGIFLFRRLLN